MREVYRCVLHTILFNRAVGWVRPRDTECEVLTRISYARIDDAALQRNVDKNVDALYAMIDKQMHASLQPTVTTTTIVAGHGHSTLSSSSSLSSPHTLTSTSTSSSPAASFSPSSVPATFTLSFYESTPSKSWFGPREDKLYWERWVLPCRVSPSKPNASPSSSFNSPTAQQRQQQSFMSVMTAIIAVVNDKRDHLPAVKGGMEGLTYSFECESVCGGGGAAGGGAGLGGGVGGGGEGGRGGVVGGGGVDAGSEDGGWGLSTMIKRAFKEGPPILIPK